MATVRRFSTTVVRLPTMRGFPAMSRLSAVSRFRAMGGLRTVLGMSAMLRMRTGDGATHNVPLAD